ncbi:MAG: hypothetical protein EZS28_030596, partial [Streblomastix strix]
LFGTKTNVSTGGGIFGQPPQQGGISGQKPTAQNTSLFGPQPNTAGSFGGIFGKNTAAPTPNMFGTMPSTTGSGVSFANQIKGLKGSHKFVSPSNNSPRERINDNIHQRIQQQSIPSSSSSSKYGTNPLQFTRMMIQELENITENSQYQQKEKTDKDPKNRLKEKIQKRYQKDQNSDRSILENLMNPNMIYIEEFDVFRGRNKI